ncbi:type II toxin-antitoxin system MqsA family antitoxin [Candidatus Poribacteria bacterium]|nr:type II toxin-antitoxin system MqsA family antitoxin [Candidatus Poribacteria bacterium]
MLSSLQSMRSWNKKTRMEISEMGGPIKMENERCDFCHEGRLKAQNVREYYRYQGEIVIIDNVPAYVCNTCGEHYHLAPVAKKLRNIAENRSKIEEWISVPITTFDKPIFETVT